MQLIKNLVERLNNRMSEKKESQNWKSQRASQTPDYIFRSF